MDEAKSGRRVTGRDEFRRLIGSAKQKPKPFDAILLWKFSRFARTGTTPCSTNPSYASSSTLRLSPSRAHC